MPDKKGSISKKQQDVIVLALSAFQGLEGESHLNFSGNIEQYTGEVLDFTLLGVDVLYFNMGTTSSFTEETSTRVRDCLNNLLPEVKNKMILSGDLHIDTEISGGLPFSPSESVDMYQKLIKSGSIASGNEKTGYLSFTRNNMGKAEFKRMDISKVLMQLCGGEISMSEDEKVVDMRMSQGDKVKTAGLGRVFSDNFDLDVRFRGISSTIGNKMLFTDVVNQIQKYPFTITLFPNRVMLYHGADTIHIQELYFSYDEFIQIIVEVLNDKSVDKKNLRQVLDGILHDRLQNLS